MVVEHAPPTPSSSRSLRDGSSREGSRPDSPFDAGGGGGGGQGSIILRIKRKRGMDPVAALRIDALQSEGGLNSEAHETAATDAGGASALAGTSPDDAAWATQTRPKRRLTDRGVFRLAETVPLSSFNSPEKRKKLEERIVRLKQRPVERSSPHLSAQTPSTPPSIAVPTATSATAKPSSSSTVSKSVGTKPDPSQLRYKVISSHAKLARRSLFDTLKANNSSGSLSLRSRHRQLRAIAGSGDHGSRTPQSASVSRLSPYSRPRYIDAVVESVGKAYRNSRAKQQRDGERTRTVTSGGTNGYDDEMTALDRRFAGLLGDYLKDQDLEAPSDIQNALDPSRTNRNGDEDSSSTSSGGEESSEEDYVYDIYYRDRGSESIGTAASAASIGLTPSEVTGHQRNLSHSGILATAATSKAVEASGVAIAPEPMATLVGLTEQDFFGLEDEEEIEQGSRLVSEELLDSDDPYEEGEDEDSNDEDFYRNDYPEQEAEEDEDVEDAGWGWAGPRRQTQRRRDSDSSEDDAVEEEDEDEGVDSDD